MGKIIRCITSDGLVMATAIDSTDIVAEAEKIHSTSAVVTAALGRLLTAGSMMGNMLKSKDNTITLRLAGGGPAGNLIVVSDWEGDVRGYVSNPVVEIPLNNKGNLYITKDLGMKEPYNGCIPLVSGEIAEDITAYYAVSEQIPTVCALGVLVNPDLTVKAAGGYIIQLLPAAGEDTIEKIEKGMENIPSVTAMLSSGETPLSILKRALSQFDVEVLYEHDVYYKCNCSKERIETALITLGAEELNKMADELPEVEVKCHFCDKAYKFSPKEVRNLAKSQ